MLLVRIKKQMPWFIAAALVGGCAWMPTPLQAANESSPSTEDAKLEFFEREIRPLLIEKCGECHIQDQAGGFSLASQELMLKGGDTGVAVIPGDAAQSLLIAAIKRELDSPMPPEKPLSAEEIARLEQWISAGAAWTKPLAAAQTVTGKDHWAFQPLQAISPQRDSVADSPIASWSLTDIDPYILQQLHQEGLQPAPAASPEQWLRRVTYGLSGLPPTAEEVRQFVQDSQPDKFERAVERLLDSPRYGQHQARLWLDLARYSDSKGYVYAREERFWVHAWNYRDWVVQAMNQDLPYDRFLTLQLAADQIDDRTQDDLAAMGFLTLGRRFLGVKHDIIDDRIDVVCRATMGLTVSCARCHNHKFDPIPTTDYYALYGVFDSSSETMVPLSAASAAISDASNPVKQKRDALESALQQKRAEQAGRVRARLADYLFAQTELHKYPADGFDQIFSTDDLLPAFVRRFQSHLFHAAQSGDSLFLAWRVYQSIPAESFSKLTTDTTAGLLAGEHGPLHPIVAQAFQDPPQSLREVADRYGRLFQQAEEQYKANPQSDLQPLWDFLHAEEGPCQVPNLGIVHTESFFDSGTCTQLWTMQGDLDRAIIQAGTAAPFAVALFDKPVPQDARVFRRGNPLDQGPFVPRKFLTALSSDNDKAFSSGSGRLELARKITDPRNPLTARVMVNRIWAQHFGQGLVPTTSDFGRRANPPSHPALLDFLALQFMQHDWSIKHLHRLLLLSATYRQTSAGPSDLAAFAAATERDPENRLLWRMTPHRLTFEEMRDSILAASGNLDDSLNGPSSPLLQPPFSNRRTLYGTIDRQFLPASFRVFDFASPDLHIPERNETTIPQQSLFLMNHPLMLHQVSLLSQAILAASESSPQPLEQQVDALFSRILRRPPTLQERSESVEFLQRGADQERIRALPTADQWQYGYGAVDEDQKRLTGFSRLPHFAGEAWQGGEAYPDGALGWVQVSRRGGHPGNDRQHASVRRWIAPGPMTIEIETRLVNEAAPGDGIRGFIISSRAGILQQENVHQTPIELNVPSLTVEAGDTIDFVVDIHQELNSDQFLWQIKIRTPSSTSDWDSERDFTPDLQAQLSPLEQLAQILFCSNEFLFVD